MDIIKSIIAIRKEQDGQRPRVSVNNDNINETIWHDDNPTNITNEQILAKQAELQAEFDSLQYQRDRKKEYPPIGDQLDYIYHNGLTKWKADMITPVKEKYPKPD